MDQMASEQTPRFAGQQRTPVLEDFGDAERCQQQRNGCNRQRVALGHRESQDAHRHSELLRLV